MRLNFRCNIRYYNLSEAHNWHADIESLEKEDLSKDELEFNIFLIK